MRAIILSHCRKQSVFTNVRKDGKCATDLVDSLLYTLWAKGFQLFTGTWNINIPSEPLTYPVQGVNIIQWFMHEAIVKYIWCSGSTKLVQHFPFSLELGIFFWKEHIWFLSITPIITQMLMYIGKVHVMPWANRKCSYWNCTTKNGIENSTIENTNVIII